MRKSAVCAACAAGLWLFAGVAWAESESGGELRVPGAAFHYHEDPPTADPAPAPQPVRFGEAGSRWWSIGAGVANDFADSTDVNLHGSISWFIAQDVEFAAELGVWYYHQPGDDQAGINPNMVFRWHFVNTGTWTVYTDVGIGLLAATGEVPEGGTSIDFTPRAGLGVTHALGDDGTRLQVGVRWAHVSNARIAGDDDNSGRDSVMLYAGVIFPF